MEIKDNHKLQKVYDFLVNFVNENGYPPSVRETCAALKIKSTATVYYHFNELEKLGYIKKSKSKNRAIELTKLEGNSFISIPIVGVITAGLPILAEENIECYQKFPEGMFKGQKLFMLNVSGESMKDAGILDGDLIVVKSQPIANNNDIVVAMIEGEATVKRLLLKDEKIILHPENKKFQDMELKNVEILGVVVGSIRKY